MENTPKTWRQAQEQGYREYDYKKERGYTSRKINPDNQCIHIAKGNRKGQLYYYAPCWDSTQYHIRVYITK